MCPYMRNAVCSGSGIPRGTVPARSITACTPFSTGAGVLRDRAINDREMSFHKDVGLVGEVFHPDILDRLNGTMAVGHVRYSTTGGGWRENAQPLTLKYVKGTLAVAHNGNLVNTRELAHRL